MQEEVFQVVGKSITVGGDLVKVKFSFTYDGINCLKVKVISMDDRLRGIGRLMTHCEKDKVFFISSNNCPELRCNELFLFGKRKDADNRNAFCVYENAEERNTALYAFINAIEKINNVDIYQNTTKSGNITAYTVGGPELKVTFTYSDEDTILGVFVDSQSNGLRNNLEVSDGHYTLTSYASPELTSYGRHLYVRGTDPAHDNYEPHYSYLSQEDREKAINAFKKLIILANYPWLKSMVDNY